QGTFDVVTQGNYRTLGVNFLDGTGNDAAFLVQGNEVGERIVFQLLDTQGDALTLRINGQDDGFQLVALLEAASGLFARPAPAHVGQGNQAVDGTGQADGDAEVGDGLGGTGGLVALVELGGELFPGVYLALLDTQGDTTTVFVDVQNHDFHFVANLNDLG